MTQEADPPIVITGGGSIQITFDEAAFPEVASGDFASPTKSVTRVEVIVGGRTVLDETVKDGDATVRVHYL